jgi:hypothetical protein
MLIPFGRFVFYLVLHYSLSSSPVFSPIYYLIISFNHLHAYANLRIYTYLNTQIHVYILQEDAILREQFNMYKGTRSVFEMIAGESSLMYVISYLGIIIVFGSYLFIYFDRIVCDLLVFMPFWLVCILHMEHSFLVCVVNEFCVSKHHHHLKSIYNVSMYIFTHFFFSKNRFIMSYNYEFHNYYYIFSVKLGINETSSHIHLFVTSIKTF